MSLSLLLKDTSKFDTEDPDPDVYYVEKGGDNMFFVDRSQGRLSVAGVLETKRCVPNVPNKYKIYIDTLEHLPNSTLGRRRTLRSLHAEGGDITLASVAKKYIRKYNIEMSIRISDGGQSINHHFQYVPEVHGYINLSTAKYDGLHRVLRVTLENKDPNRYYI